jgi:hypothetical protein
VCIGWRSLATLGSTPSVDAYCAVLLRIFADLASNLDSPPAMVQHNDRIAFNCAQVRAGGQLRDM